MPGHCPFLGPPSLLSWLEVGLIFLGGVEVVLFSSDGNVFLFPPPRLFVCAEMETRTGVRAKQSLPAFLLLLLRGQGLGRQKGQPADGGLGCVTC